MSWSGLEQTQATKEEAEKRSKERAAAEVELSKKFARVFGTDDGQVVYQNLFKRFVLENETPLNAQNVQYEAGYHAGEAGAVKYITHQITKAKLR